MGSHLRSSAAAGADVTARQAIEAESPRAFLAKVASRSDYVVALKANRPFSSVKQKYYYEDGFLVLKPEEAKHFATRAEAEKVVADLAENGTEAWVEATNSAHRPIIPKKPVREAQVAKPLMVIVHPGSLCGSYHASPVFDEKNLTALLQEIQNWSGEFAVVHGELSDELEAFKDVGQAIAKVAQSGVARDYEAGATGSELRAVARKIAKDAQAAARSQVMVTGAWGEADGCARTVFNELVRLGVKAELSKFVPTFEAEDPKTALRQAKSASWRVERLEGTEYMAALFFNGQEIHNVCIEAHLPLEGDGNPEVQRQVRELQRQGRFRANNAKEHCDELQDYLRWLESNFPCPGPGRIWVPGTWLKAADAKGFPERYMAETGKVAYRSKGSSVVRVEPSGQVAQQEAENPKAFLRHMSGLSWKVQAIGIRYLCFGSVEQPNLAFTLYWGESPNYRVEYQKSDDPNYSHTDHFELPSPFLEDAVRQAKMMATLHFLGRDVKEAEDPKSTFHQLPRSVWSYEVKRSPDGAQSHVYIKHGDAVVNDYDTTPVEGQEVSDPDELGRYWIDWYQKLDAVCPYRAQDWPKTAAPASGFLDWYAKAYGLFTRKQVGEAEDPELFLQQYGRDFSYSCDGTVRYATPLNEQATSFLDGLTLPHARLKSDGSAVLQQQYWQQFLVLAGDAGLAGRRAVSEVEDPKSVFRAMQGGLLWKFQCQRVLENGNWSSPFPVYARSKDKKSIYAKLRHDYPQAQLYVTEPVAASAVELKWWTDGNIQVVESEADDIAKEAAKAEQPKSQEQADAGNQKKGHVRWHGLEIAIENAKGSVRKSKDPENPWQVTMFAHYGYIKGTVGKDKDHIDIFLGDHPSSLLAFVVNQVKKDGGAFDEHKIMAGFKSKDEAISTYDKSFTGDLGPKLRKSVVSCTVDQLKLWLDKGDPKKEFDVLEEAESPKSIIRAASETCYVCREPLEPESVAKFRKYNAQHQLKADPICNKCDAELTAEVVALQRNEAEDPKAALQAMRQRLFCVIDYVDGIQVNLSVPCSIYAIGWQGGTDYGIEVEDFTRQLSKSVRKALDTYNPGADPSTVITGDINSQERFDLRYDPFSGESRVGEEAEPGTINLTWHLELPQDVKDWFLRRFKGEDTDEEGALIAQRYGAVEEAEGPKSALQAWQSVVPGQPLSQKYAARVRANAKCFNVLGKKIGVPPQRLMAEWRLRWQNQYSAREWCRLVWDGDAKWDERIAEARALIEAEDPKAVFQQLPREPSQDDQLRQAMKKMGFGLVKSRRAPKDEEVWQLTHGRVVHTVDQQEEGGGWGYRRNTVPDYNFTTGPKNMLRNLPRYVNEVEDHDRTAEARALIEAEDPKDFIKRLAPGLPKRVVKIYVLMRDGNAFERRIPVTWEKARVMKGDGWYAGINLHDQVQALPYLDNDEWEDILSTVEYHIMDGPPDPDGELDFVELHGEEYDGRVSKIEWNYIGFYEGDQDKATKFFGGVVPFRRDEAEDPKDVLRRAMADKETRAKKLLHLFKDTVYVRSVPKGEPPVMLRGINRWCLDGAEAEPHILTVLDLEQEMAWHRSCHREADGTVQAERIFKSEPYAIGAQIDWDKLVNQIK